MRRLHYVKPGKAGRGPRTRCGANVTDESRFTDKLGPNVCCACHFIAAQTKLIYRFEAHK